MAMLPMFLSFFSDARVGIVGFRRDEETAKAHGYYVNIPSFSSSDQIIILDPMIATGGTAAATIALLLGRGAQEENILIVALFSATPGLRTLRSAYPQVNILVAAEDPHLDQRQFIVPGLGDFGDRFFGTDY